MGEIDLESASKKPVHVVDLLAVKAADTTRTIDIASNIAKAADRRKDTANCDAARNKSTRMVLEYPSEATSTSVGTKNPVKNTKMNTPPDAVSRPRAKTNTVSDANYIARNNSNDRPTGSSHTGNSNIRAPDPKSSPSRDPPTMKSYNSVRVRAGNWSRKNSIPKMARNIESPAAPTLVHLRYTTMIGAKE